MTNIRNHDWPVSSDAHLFLDFDEVLLEFDAVRPLSVHLLH